MLTAIHARPALRRNRIAAASAGIVLRVALIAAATLVGAAATGAGGAVARDRGPEREQPPAIVILHAIGGPECRDGAPHFQHVEGDARVWAEFFRRDPVLGIHYVIGRSGDLVSVISESQVANHARGHNARSIGIELVNDGDGVDPFPEPQVRALIDLLRDIRRRHTLGADAIVTHAEVDRGEPLPCGIARKVDPGPALDLVRIIRDSTP